MKLDYQIYNDKYFNVLVILEKRYNFFKKIINEKSSEVTISEERMEFINLLKYYCPYINNKIKSEIIKFDQNQKNTFIELIEFYNSKIKKEAFEQFDIKFIYI
jgi:hypothetical protein